MAKYYSAKDKRKLYKKLSITAGCFVIVCLAMLLLLHFVDNVELKKQEKYVSEDEIVTIAGKKYVAKKGIKTVLILGNDSSVTRTQQVGAGQCDTIELLVINSRAKTYNRITINRNTMAEFESFDESGKSVGTSVAQICLAYAQDSDEKGCENVANAISKLLYDQEIDEYISIGMDAIPEINRLLGGVSVTIEDDFSKSDPTLKIGETVQLSDEQAEHYVHDRMNVADGSNENRIKRQNTYLAGAKTKLLQKCQENSSYALDFYKGMGSYMITSLNAKHFAKLVNDVVLYDDKGREVIEGTTEIGRFGYEEYTIDQEKLDELVVTLFYNPVEG